MSAASPEVPRPDVVEIEAVDLGHRFGGRPGLRQVSFSLATPGVVAVTGANGSGKTTLLRAIAGLLRPSHGRLSVRRAGQEIPPLERRLHLGLASPELSFYPELTALENLRFAAEAHGLSEPGIKARAMLERVGLQSRGEDRVSALSSGMKQRLRLAFALLHRPPVLLLDEPGSHLDEEGRQVMEEIVAGHARLGLVVIATNEEREWRLAERRVQLAGRGLGDPA